MSRSSWRVLVSGIASALLMTPSLAAPPDLSQLADVPRHELPAPAAPALDAAARKDRPYRFAIALPLQLPPAAGRWDIDGTTAIWRARLFARGAHSLSASFDAIRLPPGAELVAYDPAGRVVHGPYDAADVSPSGLWLPLVSGEELVLEVRLPRERSHEFSLGSGKAYHGFRDWKSGSAGAAGSCNIDISCSQASAWTQDAQAVAKITIGNMHSCSGQLMNNVRQDRRLLFLTAAHCGIDGASGPADSVNFYFDYVGPCSDNGTDPAPAPSFQTSDLLAQDLQSDFALLLITSSAPLPAGVFFAGWDATGAGGDSGVSIHHPRGDEKKIAFFDVPLVAAAVDIGQACAIDAWEVRWSSGTTEIGSSGGGLWNAGRRVIGVLSGGTADCSNPQGRDYYARLDRAWTPNARHDGQLKAHLSPDSCIAAIPGLNPADDPNPSPITEGPMLCEGPPSDPCFASSSGGGGGAPPAWLLLTLLAAAAWRRAPRAG